MKIYILDPFHEAGIALARQNADVVCWPDPAIKNWHEDADAVMVRMTRITAADLERAKHLKIICKQGVGVDTIDLDAAKRHGIPVCHTPGVNREAVAEMGLALALSVSRCVTHFDHMLRAGDKVDRSRFLGVEMHGKAVGIVGMGNIGTVMAGKWRGAFDAKIFAYDPYVPADRWSGIAHTRVNSLHEMLPLVNLLTLHVPLTQETRHMIGRDELAMMKKDAVLINVSRGGVVDEQALYDSLKDGHLFGAGLDVFEVEPPPSDHPLLSLANVVATPHAAGGTFDTQIRSALQVAQQVIDVLNGQEPVNRAA